MEIRSARTSDIKGIRALIDTYAIGGRLLTKETVTLYESVQEFTVAIENNEVVGCGALHVLWEDLAEVRTVAVVERLRGTGVGHQIMQAIEERARAIGVKEFSVLHLKHNSLVDMDLKKFKELLLKPMCMPSFFVHMTLVSPNSSTLRV
jgi:N-acetylglutamate synthase-like GNAT family acetyltransferase